MRFGSVCSGIEAATVAWASLGFEPQWLSEIEAFPSDLLKQRHPGAPNLGDMRRIHEKKEFKRKPIDLLVGGTPCQSFSVAGLRAGLADPRGNLALVFLSLLGRARPRWVVWENVPGVLSSWSDEAESFAPDQRKADLLGAVGGGTETGWQSNDFDTFTCGLRELGYGLAWRVLDAQFYGVPQRRRRVFVVGYLGDWRRAAAVLFESSCLSWDPPPSREAGKIVTGTLEARTRSEGGLGDIEFDGGLIANTLMGKPNDSQDPTLQTYVAHTLRAKHDSSHDGETGGVPIIPIQGVQGIRNAKQNGIGVGKEGDGMFTLTSRDRHAIAFSSKDHGADAMTDVSPTLRAGGHDGSHANAGVPPAIAFEPGVMSREGGHHYKDVSGTLRKDPGDNQMSVATKMHVRRLTPRECERLQGFPDDYTLITRRGKGAADGPRYKALGNSMAVPVMRWIGKRIAMVDVLK